MSKNYSEFDQGSLHEFIEYDDLQREVDQNMTEIANGPQNILRFPRKSKVTRQDVVAHFNDAFEMIGGVERLAIWADANPTEFYKLYSKLLPSATTNVIEGNITKTIRHALPPPRIGEVVDAEIEEEINKELE